MELKKAYVSVEMRRLLALMGEQEKSIKKAFLQFIKDMSSRSVVDEVTTFLEHGDVDGVLRFMDSYVSRMGDTITAAFVDAGIAASADLARRIGNSRLAISFDPTYPRAAELMRTNKLLFVQEFTKVQRDLTRQILIDALREGKGPRAAALLFRDSIGLTTSQYEAVNNYRDLLTNNSSDALDRVLRDRRSDSTVENAIEAGEPLAASVIDRMVTSYEDNMLSMRAETIARTETNAVLNSARQESVLQMIDQTGIDPGTVVRVWRATDDDRTRDTHAEMDGQEVGLEEPFESPSGAQLMYPGDDSLGAPPEEIINCRCVVLTRIEASSSVDEGVALTEADVPEEE